MEKIKLKTTDYNRLVLYSNNLDLIEEGLKLVSIYYSFSQFCQKSIDILCKDQKGNLVIIEEKSRKISGRLIINKLVEYFDLLKNDFPDDCIRAILIAPDITDNMKNYLLSFSNYNIKFHIHDYIDVGYKSMNITEINWKKLIKIKYKDGFDNLNDVITYLLKNI